MMIKVLLLSFSFSFASIFFIQPAFALTCQSPNEEYQGQCVDPLPSCQNPPAHGILCIDVIENGVRIERYNFSCVKGYIRQNKDCVLESLAKPRSFPEVSAVKWKKEKTEIEVRFPKVDKNSKIVWAEIFTDDNASGSVTGAQLSPGMTSAVIPTSMGYKEPGDYHLKIAICGEEAERAVAILPGDCGKIYEEDFVYGGEEESDSDDDENYSIDLSVEKVQWKYLKKSKQYKVYFTFKNNSTIDLDVDTGSVCFRITLDGGGGCLGKDVEAGKTVQSFFLFPKNYRGKSLTVNLDFDQEGLHYTDPNPANDTMTMIIGSTKKAKR